MEYADILNEVVPTGNFENALEEFLDVHDQVQQFMLDHDDEPGLVSTFDAVLAKRAERMAADVFTRAFALVGYRFWYTSRSDSFHLSAAIDSPVTLEGADLKRWVSEVWDEVAVELDTIVDEVIRKFSTR